MFIRFLFAFDLLFNIFRIASWPSVGKEQIKFTLEHDVSFSGQYINFMRKPVNLIGFQWDPKLKLGVKI